MLRRRARAVRTGVAAGVGALVLLLAGCGGTSPTSELAEDPTDTTIAGPPPTAPVTDPDAGLSASGVDLLEQLNALTEQRDLCGAVGSDPFVRLLSEDFDTTAMVTAPAGVTRIVAEVNRVFSHLLAIAPPDIRPQFEVINDAWRRIVLVNPNLPDVTERINAISAEPQLMAAEQAVGRWMVLNCGQSLTG